MLYNVNHFFLDRIVVRYDNVSRNDFESIKSVISVLHKKNMIKEYVEYIGQSIKDYRYNLKIGDGAGAIFIGYQHNSKDVHSNTYAMKIEANPSKSRELDEVSCVITVINKILDENYKISTLDITKDYLVPVQSIIAKSTTGKRQMIINKNKYFGSRKNDGRLKIYDKNKDLLDKYDIESKYDDLTRIEYTYKAARQEKDSITLEEFYEDVEKHLSPAANYEISVFDSEKAIGKPDVISCVLAIQNGIYEMNDFTRTMQKKIKESLSDCREVNLLKEICDDIDYIVSDLDTFMSINVYEKEIDKYINMSRLVLT